MAAVRGIPNEENQDATGPQYVPLPSIFEPAARKAALAENHAIRMAYYKNNSVEISGKDFFDYGLTENPAKANKGFVIELSAARFSRFRVNATKGHFKQYDDPTQYITDLWKDGYLTDEQTQDLLGKLQKDGEITTEPQGSVRSFLQNQAELDHIDQRELNMMLAWERKPAQAQNKKEMAALREQITQQFMNAGQGLDEGQAALEAMKVINELKQSPRTEQVNEYEALEREANQSLATKDSKSLDVGDYESLEAEANKALENSAGKSHLSEQLARREKAAHASGERGPS